MKGDQKYSTNFSKSDMYIFSSEFMRIDYTDDRYNVF